MLPVWPKARPSPARPKDITGSQLFKSLPLNILRTLEVELKGLGLENSPLNKFNQFALYFSGDVAKAERSKARPILTCGALIPNIW